MAKRKYDASKLNGISIYHDSKNRVVFSPSFSKKGYILSDENVSEYQNYSQSFLVTVIIFLVMYYLTYSILYSLLLSITYLGISIFMFYLRCLRKVAVIENFKKPEKDTYIIRQAKNVTKRRLIVIFLACIFLSFFIFLNAMLQGYYGKILVINYIFMALAVLYGFLNLYILTVKKKNGFVDIE